MQQHPIGPRAVLAFICVLVVWGTTYLGVAWVLRELPVFLSSAMRFMLASLVLYGLLRAQGPRPLAGLATPRALLSGVLMSGCGTGFTAVAMLGMATGVAALLNATIPICVTLLAWAFFDRRRPGTLTAIGLVTGVLGVALVVGGGAEDGRHSGAPYVAAMVFAVTAWSVGTMLQRNLAPRDRLLALCCVQFAAGSAFLATLGLATGEWRELDLPAVSLQAWGALAYLVLIGSVLTQSSYLWLLARYPAEKVTTYAIINPAIALLLGAVFLDEPVTGSGLLGALLILGGVSVVLFERPLRALIARA